MNYLAGLLAPFVLFGAYIGSVISPEPELGASEAIPTTIAFFETTLAGAISSSATTFTLTSATDKDGTTLASSTYAFVIDEGSSNEEIVIADCTGTSCTNASRGVSVRTGNTEVAALKKAHRRGASVKITDAPLLPLVSRILRGEEVVSFTPSIGGNLVTKTYVDSLALGTTTVAATTLDDGIVELATGTEAASSTATGNSGSPLTLHTGISTSTAPTTGSYVVVTGADGNIDPNFISSSAPFVEYASTTKYTGSATWTKQTGLLFVIVEVQAAGGNGAGGVDNGASGSGGAGGGGGGYTRKIILADDLGTTETVTVGAVGSASSFGSHASSTSGSNASGETPGEGGVGSGGDVNVEGDDGAIPADASSASAVGGGHGGSSMLGGGGKAGRGAGGNGSSGNAYGGGGGGGGANDSGTMGTGAAGAPGIVIITEYF